MGLGVGPRPERRGLIRVLAAAVGLSPSRASQLLVVVELDELDAAIGQLREAGWPCLVSPGSPERGLS